MKSKWYRIIIPLMLLSINIEKRVHSLSFNHKFDNNLKLLQESLRWIRSPVTNTRFRPWGGKRRARPEYSVISVPNYQILCQKPLYSLDLSLYSKCQQNEKGKNGMFKGSGEEDMQDGFNKENFLKSGNSAYDIEKGMPENVNDGFAQLENKPLKNLEIFMGNEEGSTEKRGRAFHPWAGKRLQAFYPWAGKRDRAFYPWAGKRDHAFYPWAGKRDHAFYPWAGKRAHSFYPWAGKRANQINNEDIYNQEINDTKTKDFDKTILSQRDRRETTMDNTQNSNLVSKRMYVQYWRENTKRFGVLSDLLKKFETIKDGPNPRSFHPWAGKKRAENDIQMKNNNNNNNSTPNLLITDPNDEKQPPIEGESTSLKRSFYDWAGTRHSY